MFKEFPFFVFGKTGVWTESFTLAMEVFYLLVMPPPLFIGSHFLLSQQVRHPPILCFLPLLG
jgi:hypothetical protein